MSIFFISLITLTLNGVAGSQIPKATGLTNFTRITAGGFGASLTTTFWDRGASLNQTRLAEIAPSNGQGWLSAVDGLRHMGLDRAHALGVITGQFVNQAYLLATLDFFRVSAWLMILMAPLVWLTRPARGGGGGAVAAD
jgi:DHA2 family multidrug resistance protein